MRTYHDGISMPILALTARTGLSRLKVNQGRKSEETKARKFCQYSADGREKY
jgi:hypothetical protein